MKHRRKAATAAPVSRTPAAAPPAAVRSVGVLGGALLASAAALGAAALVVRARARRAEREHPPHGHFLDIEGVRLHYVERGDGAPVVFLHGNGAMIEDWEISGVLDLAARHHRVLAFDRPGFGYSSRPRSRIWTPAAQAELLHRALRRLGVDRPIVVGHSWGTLVALALALQHPEEVRGLVLLAGYYFPTARADVALLSPPAVPVIGDVMRYTVSPLLGRLAAPKMIRKIFAPRRVPPQFHAEFPVGLMLRPSQIRASAADTALMAPGAAELRGRYGQLRMPVAIMAGSADEIVDVDGHAQRLHAEIPGSELRLIDGGGHMIHHLVPREVVELIRLTDRRADQLASRVRAAAE
jgi:pimeloyl-ACP methyl ester carboxylesterase